MAGRFCVSLTRAKDDTDRATVGIALRADEAAEHLDRLPGRPAAFEGHEHDVVAGQRLAIPGAMLADEHPEMGARSPLSVGGSPLSLCLYVEDVDALSNKAVAAGAKVYGAARDPRSVTGEGVIPVQLT